MKIGTVLACTKLMGFNTKNILLLLLSATLLSIEPISAQEINVGATVRNGDTLLVEYLHDAVISAPRDRSYRSSRKYKKTLERVKKMYPYAMLGAKHYQTYLNTEQDFETKKDRKKYLKKEEKDLKEKFEGQIRKVTIKEGVILVKLIDRQTSHTSYEILQELKGNTSAFLWQGVARLFSSSLKHQYDPDGDDWMIEEIIGRIQTGEIKVYSLQNS